jgi:hypothetical protein
MRIYVSSRAKSQMRSRNSRGRFSSGEEGCALGALSLKGAAVVEGVLNSIKEEVNLENFRDAFLQWKHERGSLQRRIMYRISARAAYSL